MRGPEGQSRRGSLTRSRYIVLFLGFQASDFFQPDPLPGPLQALVDEAEEQFEIVPDPAVGMAEALAAPGEGGADMPDQIVACRDVGLAGGHGGEAAGTASELAAQRQAP